MTKLYLLALGVIFFSCNQLNEENIPKEANMVCNDFFILGKYQYSTYTFCSTAPVEIEYAYKVGRWKYWNRNKKLIAEGIYKVGKRKVVNEGGCSFEIKESEIQKKNWKFWDINGNQIEPDDNLTSKIKSCQPVEIVKDV